MGPADVGQGEPGVEAECLVRRHKPDEVSPRGPIVIAIARAACPRASFGSSRIASAESRIARGTA